MPDLELTAEIAHAANGVALTFHRAFDDAVRQDEALEWLAQLRPIDRVLTSGGHGDWNVRLARLKRWGGTLRPSVLVGGGLTLDNLAAVAGIPGIHEVHVGRAARAGALVAEPVDAHRVAALVSELARLAQGVGDR